MSRTEINKSIRANILSNQYYKCNLCKVSLKNRTFELDHIIPFNKSKNNNIDNLQILCIKCHRDKTISEGHFGKSSEIYQKKCVICKKKLESLSSKRLENDLFNHYKNSHKDKFLLREKLLKEEKLKSGVIKQTYELELEEIR